MVCLSGISQELSLIFQEEIESGTIIVEPLTERWIPELTDLLVDTFRSSLGYKGMRCADASSNQCKAAFAFIS